MWIASAARSQTIDRLASERFGLAPEMLMERAAEALLQFVETRFSPPARLAIVCGKGHNGGDGIALGRLAAQKGYRPSLILVEPSAEFAAETQRQLRRAQSEQGLIFLERYSDFADYDLIVDALLGTGAKGAPRDAVRTAIETIQASRRPVLSVDLPSGIDCDTGAAPGLAVRADWTVTFGLPKPFSLQGAGLTHAGEVHVASLGFPAELLDEPTEGWSLGEEVWNFLPERNRNAHKGTSGSLLIVAGSDPMRGAAVLAAKGALMSGAGLVRVAALPTVCAALAAQLPEAMLIPLETPADLKHSLGDLQVDAAVFGPGLGRTFDPFLTELWRTWERPCVIDADALSLLAVGTPLPTAPCVLTPHPGEMARLLGRDVASVQQDRIRAVRDAARRYAACTLLKGPSTLIAEAEGPYYANSTGNPGMATGGMGDVLSGVIGTLLAQGLPPLRAATLGAFWHGRAGDRAADRYGPRGFTAGELADCLRPAPR